MSKEAEKAEWKRRRAIEVPKPRTLHVSKTWAIVRNTHTGLPVARFAPGRTFRRKPK